MKGRLPDAFAEFVETVQRLESHYRDMQDIEFTVEDGKLFLLQTRSAKRTAAAALKAAVDMVDEGLISREEAVARIDPGQLDQLLHPRIDPDASYDVAAKGLNASPGAASGAVVFDADTAELRGKEGEAVILVRWETTPDDIHGMIAAQGILTAHGGMTSHAAVVARGMGKPCVAGCEALSLDMDAKTMSLNGTTLKEGETLTIDGGTGEVIAGEVKLIAPDINEDFETVLGWADDLRRLRVRTNADTPEDAAKAREFGAEGIGLCRTEHMFMADDRLPVVREMIMASSEDERRSALDRLLPHQQSDFEGIFEAMAGLPVTIRLLDPPLHEFLPPPEEATDARMRARIRALHESNPMLGTRGCRLGLMYPEIYEMQVRAIIRAAIAVRDRTGDPPLVEIMHPLVGFEEELRRLRELTIETADEEGDVEYLVGTMIELPRACIRADEIAEHADFFSFGTNDLTQTALGFSRDDAEGKFLTHYLQDGVLERNPFEMLDQRGVGDLMAIAVERGRSTKPDIKLGICGEHGGEPSSVAFCHTLGLDYVSCSPYRVPLARLAAAQAALGRGGRRGGRGRRLGLRRSASRRDALHQEQTRHEHPEEEEREDDRVRRSAWGEVGAVTEQPASGVDDEQQPDDPSDVADRLREQLRPRNPDRGGPDERRCREVRHHEREAPDLVEAVGDALIHLLDSRGERPDADHADEEHRNRRSRRGGDDRRQPVVRVAPEPAQRRGQRPAEPEEQDAADPEEERLPEQVGVVDRDEVEDELAALVRRGRVRDDQECDRRSQHEADPTPRRQSLPSGHGVDCPGDRELRASGELIKVKGWTAASSFARRRWPSSSSSPRAGSVRASSPSGSTSGSTSSSAMSSNTTASSSPRTTTETT